LSTEVCRELGLPKTTVGEWRAYHPEFRRAYIEAFTTRCFGMGEEALEVLNAVPKGADMATVMLARAKADKLCWMASRLVPAFADRHEHQLTGSARIHVYLPTKSTHDSGQLIEGVATDVLTDETAES
jgi:hypothetical protein